VIELTLPYPPSVNRTLRAVNGRVILSKRYRDWILAAGRAVAAQLPTQAPIQDYRLWIAMWAVEPPVKPGHLRVRIYNAPSSMD